MSNERVHQRQRLNLLWAALLGAGLAACGGSDDPLPAAPAPAPPPVQANPPVITAQPQNATAAEGALASFSVAATSDGGAIAYQWRNQGTGADIAGATSASYTTPALSLADNARAFLARLTNTAGTTTSASATLSVTERSWRAPQAFLGQQVRQLASVADSNGHTHILAITGNNLQAGVQAHLMLRGADATAAPVPASPSGAALQALAPLSGATSIRVAANGLGHVLAVWNRNGIIGGALYTPAQDTAAAGAWTLLPTRINDFASTSVSDPDVAAIRNDGFEIVWRERTASSGPHDLKGRTYAIVGNALGTIESLEASATETGAPRIVGDAAGNMLAAWLQTGTGVVVNRRRPGGTWGTSVEVADNNGVPLETLRANAQGKAVLLSSNRQGIAYAALADMAANTVVTQQGAYVANANGSAPDAVVATDGRVHVFGVSRSGSGTTTNSRLFHWTHTSNGGWSSPEAISDNSTLDHQQGLGLANPQVSAIDREGNFVVSWQERTVGGDNVVSVVRARRFHLPLSAWRPTADLGNATWVAPSVGLGADGRATVVYQDTSVNTVQAATLR